VGDDENAMRSVVFDKDAIDTLNDFIIRKFLFWHDTKRKKAITLTSLLLPALVKSFGYDSMEINQQISTALGS